MGNSSQKPEQTPTKRVHPRYRVKLAAKVVAKSLGTPIPYKFTTDNVSQGGAYIAGSKKDYPFRKESILEVWLTLQIDPEIRVFFNAKIMHETGDGSFGLKIIQIDSKNEKILKDFLERFVTENPDTKMIDPNGVKNAA